MKAKHTQGPWQTAGYKNIIVNTEGGYTICVAPHGHIDEPIEVVQANARLIASAPELLDAVIAVHDYLCDKDPRADRRHEIQNLLETLIAKANGEL